MNKLVVFDIDGVVCDFEGRLVTELAKKFGDGAFANRDKFTLEERYEREPEILDEALKLTANPNFYYGLNPIYPSIQLAEKLSEEGFMVMFLTSRPKSAHNFTYRWLFKWTTVEPVNLFSGVSDKADFLSNMNGSVEFVVEDSPAQIEGLRDRGIPVLCWDQAWNEGIFPRLYVRSDHELMLWADPALESEPFWEFFKEDEVVS